MLADFCNTLYDTRIESDTVSSDGFEVCNLISRDVHKKRQGFLAARFVKPVVSILVSFPFPVDLCAINVNPQVGGQKTCGLEILSASLRHACGLRSKLVNSNPNGGDLAVFHSYEHILNVNNIKQEFNSFFNQILRVRMEEGKVGHFLNHCFRESSSADFDSKILCTSPDSIQSYNLKQGNRLHNTSHLWIRITQVHKGSVPCLGALELVGKPSKNCSAFVLNYARVITLRLTRESEGHVYKELDDTSGKTNLSECKTELVFEGTAANDTSPVDNVPSEFIDPITFNIMTLPILLPSGNTIDNSTLEKHISTEKNWGRQPSDPFTGVPLGSRVVPNAALKFRIDNFLLSADIKVGECGRTVGSSSDCNSTAKLKFNSIVKESKNKNVGIKRKECTIEIQQPPLKKQRTVNWERVSRRPDSLDDALENVLRCRQKSTDSRNENIVEKKSVKTSSLLLSSSNFSFTELAEQQDKELNNQFANTTNQGCSHQHQTAVLFQLPCQHVVCRQCLTCAVQTKQCLYCLTSFEKRDVARVHCKRTTTDETLVT